MGEERERERERGGWVRRERCRDRERERERGVWVRRGREGGREGEIDRQRTWLGKKIMRKLRGTHSHKQEGRQHTCRNSIFL